MRSTPQRITVNDFVLGSTPSNGYLWSPRPGAPRALTPWSSPWIDNAPGISTGLPRHANNGHFIRILPLPTFLLRQAGRDIQELIQLDLTSEVATMLLNKEHLTKEGLPK
ncbi:463_t:CDS:2 [Funneliformis geosporum]|uniref:463_t:CDS:1 n=1 Tax=Funneliformis geosporum TaxID=1117311 RepID=A0A9W4X596_9GLOM|nr:463_t:CDS:2 [Funneliformis geosporum]